MLSSKKQIDYIAVASFKKPDLCFRFMKEDDLENILKIERASFSVPWSKFYFIHEINFNKDAFLIVMLKKVIDEELIIGYTDLWKEKECFHMANFAIEPRFRQKGYGASFLHFCMCLAEELAIDTMKLEVRISNHAAIHLYKKAGFQITSILQRYYIDNNEDGYLMIADVRKSLKIMTAHK